MAPQVSVTFLGGLGDIGRNCAALETEGRIVLLDCGQLFANEVQPGVDSILPDLDYLIDNGDRIEACICTHGHEDHIGALPKVLAAGLSFPIYGSAFTLGLVRHRLEEAGVLGQTELRELHDHDRVEIGPFDCEFLPVTHSVPGGLISAIGTPQGIILHSSDFKLDLYPIDGRRTDLSRIGSIAEDPGVRLLLADSTNSDVGGASRSESEIGGVLREVFRQNEGRRIICASFASHIHRVQQVVEAALLTGRKIAPLGLSMMKNITLARRLGILRIPDASFLDIEEVHEYEPGEICVVSTGSQGEPRSALARAADGSSRWIRVDEHDTVILSSHPIPGNEEGVARVINGLIELGAKVVHSGDVDVHTSGHGKRDELTTLHSVAMPEYFTPVHGEYRHLVAHAGLAKTLDMADDRVLLARDGDRLVLSDDGIELDAGVASGAHFFVNGKFTSPKRDALDERLILGSEGVVTVVVAIDFDAGEIASSPWVETRGWLDTDELTRLCQEMSTTVGDAVSKELRSADWDRTSVTRKVRRAAGTFVNEVSSRRPMIVPVVVAA